MAFTLTLNDDLTSTLKRYEMLIKGRKPKAFKPQGAIGGQTLKSEPEKPPQKKSKTKPSSKKGSASKKSTGGKKVSFQESESVDI